MICETFPIPTGNFWPGFFIFSPLKTLLLLRSLKYGDKGKSKITDTNLMTYSNRSEVLFFENHVYLKYTI